MQIRAKQLFALSFIFLFSCSAAFAQQAPPLEFKPPVERLKSSLMGREMPYRIILPAGYSTRGDASRYPVIYLLHGLFGHYDNWTTLTKLNDYAAAYRFIIVTPEGGNGWYTDSSASKNEKYESYIIRELIPEIDKKYRTINSRDGRLIAGLSMGGYGAIKFGLKYPEMFSVAGSFSGALGAAAWPYEGSDAIGKSLSVVFGPTGSETRRSNDIFQMVRDLTPEKIKALPFIYLDCGTEDFLFQNNREFVGLLVEKKVPHEYRQLPGGHTWPYWDAQVQEFLRIADRRTAK